eukprot:COSAG01_NODE_3032_length_6694_cov_13.505231_2_plen_159_part_00
MALWRECSRLILARHVAPGGYPPRRHLVRVWHLHRPVHRPLRYCMRSDPAWPLVRRNPLLGLTAFSCLAAVLLTSVTLALGVTLLLPLRVLHTLLLSMDARRERNVQLPQVHREPLLHKLGESCLGRWHRHRAGRLDIEPAAGSVAQYPASPLTHVNL